MTVRPPWKLPFKATSQIIYCGIGSTGPAESIIHEQAVHGEGSAVSEEEDEEEGEEQCRIQGSASAAVQGGSGGEDGVRFVPGERHVTDVSLATGNAHLHRQLRRVQETNMGLMK